MEHVHCLKRICPIHLCTCNDDGSPALEIWGLDGSCPKILKQDSPNRTAPNRKGYHFCCPKSAMNELGSSKSCKMILRKTCSVSKIWRCPFSLVTLMSPSQTTQVVRLQSCLKCWPLLQDIAKNYIYNIYISSVIFICIHTLQGTNPYFTLGKGRNPLKSTLGGDMLVPRRASTKIGVRIDHQFVRQSHDCWWSLQIMTYSFYQTNHEWNHPEPFGDHCRCCKPMKVKIETIVQTKNGIHPQHSPHIPLRK